MSSDPTDYDKDDDYDNEAVVRSTSGGKEGLCTAVVSVFVDSCRNLDSGRKGRRAPSPQVHLWTSGRDPVSSSVAHYSRDPVYEEEFALPVSNPTADCLHLKVSDERGRGASLGEARLHLSDLLTRPDSSSLRTGQPVPLEAKDGGGGGGAGGGDSGGCAFIAVDIAFPVRSS